MMENIARCRDGRLAGIEAEFYKMAERVLHSYRAMALAG
jgi:hypothetical protein